ncbi:MAG TPA: hypothetical protein VK155_03820 [Bacteroidales bacterium]|jgi:hypothetical protein|nr:hypothetical protein [Bacteroidales bacterium]
MVRKKKDYFILEFFKSGPFILLIVMAFLIILGAYLTNHKKDVVKMREDVIYIAPGTRH